MAFSPKLISFLFLLTICSMQIHARDSQFFSKVSSSTPTTTTNAQDKALPNKQQENLNKQEQEPAFIPDTQNNGYGLYGQESTQFPTTTKLGESPSTTTNNNYHPYNPQFTPQTQQSYNNYPTDSNPNYNNNYNNNNYKYNNNNQYSNSKNNNNNNGYYEEQQQDFGHETSYQESGYTTMGNQNNYNNNYNGANGYNNNADQRQGMSDTRYLEHGRYYYDLKNENNNNNNNYYPNQYQQNSRDHYNTNKGYYNNNNGNSNYEYSNNMQRYDNQDDFEESPEEQYDP